ncbi:MAG: hypothetical protein WAM11_10885 [Cyanobium sp.]
MTFTHNFSGEVNTCGFVLNGSEASGGAARSCVADVFSPGTDATAGPAINSGMVCRMARFITPALGVHQPKPSHGPRDTTLDWTKSGLWNQAHLIIPACPWL